MLCYASSLCFGMLVIPCYCMLGLTTILYYTICYSNGLAAARLKYYELSVGMTMRIYALLCYVNGLLGMLCFMRLYVRYYTILYFTLLGWRRRG